MNIAIGRAAEALKHLPDLHLSIDGELATAAPAEALEIYVRIGWVASVWWRREGTPTETIEAHGLTLEEALDKLVSKALADDLATPVRNDGPAE